MSRCRITLTLHPDQKEYNDTITKRELLNYINEFLSKGLIVEKMDITFQCSYAGDVFDNTYDNTGVRFRHDVDGIEFAYTIHGFSQVTKEAADFAHGTVLRMMKDAHKENRELVSFLGVGGESLIYGIVNAESLYGSIYTNSVGVHRDNLENLENLKEHINEVCVYVIPTCHLVDYRELEDYEMEVHEPTICVTNVSRNGLRRTLCKKLDQMYIREIIGVYCTDAYKDDLPNLPNYYVEEIAEGAGLYIVRLKRIPFVSLGNDCTIAYQLRELGLRDARYPFDWIRYKKVSQLITCLEDKFAKFTEIVRSRMPGGVFYMVDVQGYKKDDESKEILINAYGMEFPHDTREEMIRYIGRIERMMKLPSVDYVIDCRITDEDMSKIKKFLPNMRRLITVEKTTPEVHTPDAWKANHMDWEKIFDSYGEP